MQHSTFVILSTTMTQIVIVWPICMITSKGWWSHQIGVKHSCTLSYLHVVDTAAASFISMLPLLFCPQWPICMMMLLQTSYRVNSRYVARCMGKVIAFDFAYNTQMYEVYGSSLCRYCCYSTTCCFDSQ